MPRFGYNLENYFEKYKNEISQESIYNLGIQIINILEKVHQAGFIYNDLKLDNLLIGFNDRLPTKHKQNENCFKET